ncbi:MAG TPA: GDP-mannose 4,6-dehydratase [Thermoplasmata archaeon]|nr:GDP-mannose 4,6-dehydratase [Thermoplasmata archaeon]
MKVLVTGGSGFIGRYLSDYLASRGHEVTGTYLSRAELSNRMPLHEAVTWVPLDVRDGAKVREVVERTRPDAVFHLAAQAYANQSWKDPADTFDTNILGTIYLYEALLKNPPSEGILLAASASAYGSGHPLPIAEDAPFRPINPYGVSKASQELISYQYAHNFGMRIVRARLFITTGPGKRGDALNDFAQQVVAVERTGRPGELRVGNLETRRDISDVRDVVRAIWTVFESGEPDRPVNVGRGEACSIRWMAEQLCGQARVPVTIATDRALFRPSDEPEIRADVRRLAELGYAPQVGLDRTLRDALEYWREDEGSPGSAEAKHAGRAPRRPSAGADSSPRDGPGRGSGRRRPSEPSRR